MGGAGEDLPEGLSEEGVEHGVDEGVQGGVQVAQPGDEVNDLNTIVSLLLESLYKKANFESQATKLFSLTTRKSAKVRVIDL